MKYLLQRCLQVIVLAGLSGTCFTACKPGVYYPFGGGPEAQAAQTTQQVPSKSNAHPVVHTDLIAS